MRCHISELTDPRCSPILLTTTFAMGTRKEAMQAASPKVILVTGASSGIGRACALHLARAGHHVYGTTRRDPTSVAADTTSSHTGTGRLEIIRLDVDDEDSVLSGVQAVVEREGRIDSVVHCAGFGIAGPVEETSEDEARAIFETNLFGTLRISRAVLPVMRAQGSGTMVHLSSIGGRIAVPYQGLYSATKFAVEGLVEALRMEVRRFGIRVVLVEPGDFCTGFTDRRIRVRNALSDGPYSDAFERAIGIAEADERNGQSPESIARLVERILAARSPRIRYTIGPVAQRLAVRLKSLLPSKIFEWALGLYYRTS